MVLNGIKVPSITLDAVVTKVYPHGAVELFDKEHHHTFKVNGQRIKPYYEGFSTDIIEEVNLEEAGGNN